MNLLFFIFPAVHHLLKDRLSDGLTNHNPKHCIICNPEAASSDLESGEDFHPTQVFGIILCDTVISYILPTCVIVLMHFPDGD